MAKLEYLNSFFIERLMSVAGEIFEAVQDTVCAYEEEIERSKRENQRLRKILCEVNVNRRTAASSDVQTCHADGALLEPKSIKGQVDSDPSVLQLKLKMAAMKKEDNQTREAVPEEVTKSNHEPPDTESSIIQVKVELSAVHQVESQDPSNSSLSSSSPSFEAAYNKDPPHQYCGKTVSDEMDSGLCNSSGVTVKLEPMDSEIICSNNAAVAQREITSKNNLEAFRDDQATSSSQSNMSLEHSSPAETHFQSQPFQRVIYCDYCGKPFGNFRQLKEHMVEHRKDRPRPYRCDFCGKCFSYAQVLETHRRTHTGERPFPCKFCGRRFNQKSHLKDHEKIHTGERPFSCALCGKRFIRKSQVKKHCHIHHQTLQQFS